MKFTVKQYAQGLLGAIESTAPKQHDLVIDNFIKVLKKNGDLEAYEKIITEFENLTTLAENTSQVEITTAGGASVSPSLLKELNTFAKDKVTITKHEDDSIIGGVVIKVDDTLIDASLKTQLDSLKSDLKG